MGQAHGSSWKQDNQQQKEKKATSAADLGIFDFDSQSSSELDQRSGESNAHESRVPEAESARSPPPRQEAQSSMHPQQQQQPGKFFAFLYQLVRSITLHAQNQTIAGTIKVVLAEIEYCSKT